MGDGFSTTISFTIDTVFTFSWNYPKLIVDDLALSLW